jgi:hypothetical protein
MAKRIRVSDDGGTTFYTLPGSSGEKRLEAASVNDTIFGQDYGSNMQSIIARSVSGNSYFKGIAGYVASVKQGGTPTTMTGEPTTLVSTRVYQITNAIKRLISYADTLTVLDGVTDVTAQVLSIDYLNGTITFLPTYTVVGAITVTGKYLPSAVIAKARSFTLNQTAAEIDTTDYATAQANGGLRTYTQGLKTVNMDIGGIFDTTNAFVTSLLARSLLVLDVSPDGSSTTMFRGFFRPSSHQEGGNVGATEDETRTFQLWVPDGSLVTAPFSWYFATASALNLGVRKVLAAYQAGTVIKVQYLYDGTNGVVSDAIVTEASLTNSYEGQNEFRFTFRGSGATTPVP